MAQSKPKDKSNNGRPAIPRLLSRDGVILTGSAASLLPRLPAESVQATITSPPYYRQKDYGRKGQIGWEDSVSEYIRRVVEVLKEVLRVTSPTGCCFVVVGDSFVGKSLQLVPHRLAIAAADAGWTVRNDLIWVKPDAAPDGAADRWRYAHEHVLFLTKKPRGYKFNADAIRVPHSPVTIRRWGNGQKYGGPKAKVEAGPNGQRFKLGKTFRLNGNGALPRDVLEFATARSRLDHFATFPESLVERLVLATTDKGDVVLDPFAGTATTGAVAVESGRRFVGIELNPGYAALGREKQIGEGGIRTPGTSVTPYDGLANRCFQPLSHLSRRSRSTAAFINRPTRPILAGPFREANRLGVIRSPFNTAARRLACVRVQYCGEGISPADPSAARRCHKRGCDTASQNYPPNGASDRSASRAARLPASPSVMVCDPFSRMPTRSRVGHCRDR